MAQIHDWRVAMLATAEPAGTHDDLPDTIS